MQVVLERSASEEEFAVSMQFAHYLRKLAVLILDFVGLVDDYVVPLDLLEGVKTNAHTFEAGDQDVEAPLFHY